MTGGVEERRLAHQAQAGGARQPRAAFQKQRLDARRGETLPVGRASVVFADLADEAYVGRRAQVREGLRHVRRAAAGDPAQRHTVECRAGSGDR